MSIKYDKPFLTYEQQIEKLKTNYNLNFGASNILELELLKTISYYDLINGYKDCFMQDNKFLEGVSLSEIFVFSTIDKAFQDVLLRYSIYVENIFKNKMAYIIAKNKGVHYSEYLDASKYHAPNPDRKIKLDNLIIKLLNTHVKTKDTPTMFYRENHNHIPPWILFKNVTFNNIIDLYSFLKKDEKLEIISEYRLFDNRLTEDEKLELFKNMLVITRKFRNKIAHNYKIIGIKLDNPEINLSTVQKIDDFNIIDNIDIRDKRGRNDIFSMYISILFLLDLNLIYILFLKDTTIFEKIVYSGNNSQSDNTVEFYLKRLDMPLNFIKKINTIHKNELEKLNKILK